MMTNNPCRLIALCAMLVLPGCHHRDDNSLPVPSAARGGVMPLAAEPPLMHHGMTGLPALPKTISPPDAPVISASDAPVAMAPADMPETDSIPVTAPAPVAAPTESVAATTLALMPTTTSTSAAPRKEARLHAPVMPAKKDMTAPEAVAVPTPPSVGPAPAPAETVTAAVPVSVSGDNLAINATNAVVLPQATHIPGGSGNGGYVLGVGDEIRLTVYGEDDLSGQYQIGSTGIVALPLVGNVDAAGRTISQFEANVAAKLAEGYIKDPKVSVQIANYRPFFILGEVQKPGSYPYVNGMTVMSAVATAGGYTYRADHGDIRVTHANTSGKEEQDIDQTAPIVPGDIIRVTERFF